ncbi:hypothetical protein DQ772_10230 [Salmonella enterica subsp. enterica serovar Newport]|nr:hypothetical protein [Salmonella enterica subsp. enterica serovar Newport]ECA5803036.1 hypothetical protein [Salmonella enterica subsp. enterica serovar Newport]ECI3933261.1 hypothetical protein [Salmonella enterica subsp. enterica]ECU9160323.1 hypothetical protein [Salmonella enterica subsp. enterica serovar Newport str. CFSAN000599]
MNLDNDGYISGLPIPTIKKYALIRTWPAYEMKRPGCVWSHVLFIPFELFSSINNLATLNEHFNKPAGNLSKYSEKITPFYHDIQDNYKISQDKVSDIIECVYDKNTRNNIIDTPTLANIENEIFAFWSHQWPKLRRSFSFTFTGVVDRQTLKITDKNDIIFHLTEGQLNEEKLNSKKNKSKWISTLSQDMMKEQPSELRNYLWNYGKYINGGRRKIKHLIDIYNTCTKDYTSKNGSVYDVLHLITDNFSTPNESMPLINDYILKSLIHKENPNQLFELVTFYIKNKNKIDLLPIISEKYLEKIKNSLLVANVDSSILLSILLSCSVNNIYEKLIFDISAKKLNTKDIIYLLHKNEGAALYLLNRNPDIICDPVIKHLSARHIIQICSVESIRNNIDIISRLVTYLLPTNDLDIAEFFYQKYPKQLVAAYIDYLNSRFTFDISSWESLALSVIEQDFVTYTSLSVNNIETIAYIFDKIDYEQPSINNIAISHWLNFFRHNRHMPLTNNTIVLLSYIYSKLISQNDRNSSKEIVLIFISLHSYFMKDSDYNHKAWAILNKSLPRFHEWKSWDKCFRLRLSILKLCLNNNYENVMFDNLKAEKEIIKLINQDIKSIKENSDFRDLLWELKLF